MLVFKVALGKKVIKLDDFNNLQKIPDDNLNPSKLTLKNSFQFIPDNCSPWE